MTYYLKVFLLLLLAFASDLAALAQRGGKQTFDFLELPKNPKTAVLGDVSHSETTNNASLFLNNPAILDSVARNAISFNHQFYYADIGHSLFATHIRIKGIGDLAIGFENVSYGEFQGFDEAGTPIDRFKSSDNALVIGKQHSIGSFSMGVNAKAVFSNIGHYSASGLLFDIGGIFKPSMSTSFALKIINAGFFMSRYSDQNQSTLPFDISFAGSIKPQHMPVRFHVSVNDLVENDTGFETEDLKNSPLDHIRIGTEFILGKVIQARAGYDFGTRRTLRLDQTSGGAGFAFGFNIKLKKFEFAFTHSIAHVSGGTTFIALNSGLNYFKKGT